MLLAESSGNFGFLIFMLIMVLGIWQWCKWLKGNDALRGAAKKGGIAILRNLFKK